MKNFFRLLLVLFILYFSTVSNAGVIHGTYGDIKTAVRNQIKLASTNALATASLEQFISESVMWVSVDIGGVERMIKIKTVAGQAFYAVSDSVVSIIYASVIDSATQTITKDIRAWHPEFVEYTFNLDQLEGTDKDQTPKAYNLWGDTIQFIPVPVKVDTVYLKCTIEHALVDTDADSLQFSAPYVEAVVVYTCYKSMMYLGMYEDAAVYKQVYEGIKQNLLGRFTPRINMGVNEK